MGSYPPPGPPPGGVGQRIEEAIELIEMELRHAIARQQRKETKYVTTFLEGGIRHG